MSKWKNSHQTGRFIVALLCSLAVQISFGQDSTKVIKQKGDPRSEKRKAADRAHQEKAAKQREGMLLSRAEDDAAMKKEYEASVAKRAKKREDRAMQKQASEKKKQADREARARKEYEKAKARRSTSRTL